MTDVRATPKHFNEGERPSIPLSRFREPDETTLDEDIWDIAATMGRPA